MKATAPNIRTARRARVSSARRRPAMIDSIRRARSPPRTPQTQKGSPAISDHMERPTSALQGADYAVRGALNAEPHTKEVGRDAVYNHHCLRSARGDDGRRGPVAGPAHASGAFADVG